MLALTSPLFPRITLEVGGRDLVIAAPRSGYRRFIRGVEVGGAPHRAPWTRLAELKRAGEIRFDLAKRPQPWGSAERLAPPSYGPDAELEGC